MSEDVSETYQRNVERPARIVRTALRMILGAGLVVAIVLKVYMLILTDLVCAPDEVSVGGMIRCTDYLSMIGYSLAIAAAIEAAFAFFVRTADGFNDALMLSIGAAVILSLTRLLGNDVNWRASLEIGVLIAGLIALKVAFEWLQRRR